MFKIQLESPHKSKTFASITAPVDTIFEAKLYGKKRFSDLLGVSLGLGSIVSDNVWSLFTNGRYTYNMRVIAV